MIVFVEFIFSVELVQGYVMEIQWGLQVKKISVNVYYWKKNVRDFVFFFLIFKKGDVGIL